MTDLDQRLKNTQVFIFDIENTLYETIRPGIEATNFFLPTVAQKLGVDKDTFGREIGHALALQYKVAANDVVYLTPSVIRKAGDAGYLDAAEAMLRLDDIYKAQGDDLKKKIADFDALYKTAIIGRFRPDYSLEEKGFLTEEYEKYNEISRKDCNLYPHIIDLLQELRARGFPVIFVSSRNVSGLLPNITSYGLDRKADIIICAADKMSLAKPDQWNFLPTKIDTALQAPLIVFQGAGMLKKHPEGLTQVAKLLGFDITHAAMMGDNLPEDVDGMQKQGGLGILAGWGDTRPDMETLKEYHWYFAKAIAAGQNVHPDLTLNQPIDFLHSIRSLDLRADPAITSAIQEHIARISAPPAKTPVANPPSQHNKL